MPLRFNLHEELSREAASLRDIIWLCSTGRASDPRRELNHMQREQQNHNDKDLAKISETVDLINLIELNHPHSKLHCLFIANTFHRHVRPPISSI